MRFLAFFLLVFSPCFTESYVYELGVCAIYENEGEYLPEWIEFHEKQGVEKFWIYFNGTDPSQTEYLEKYIQSGLVELIDWPSDKNPEGWNAVQLGAYEDCIKRIKNECKWCAFIDADEFLFSPLGISLPDILKDFDKSYYSGVVANWVMYGTSHVPKIQTGESTLEALVLRAPVDFYGNLSFKSIVRPSRVSHFLHPHGCAYKRGFDVTENFERYRGVVTQSVSVEKLRVNHYWTRDEDYFHNIKIPRREGWGDTATRCIELNELLNSEFDDCILNFK